MSRYDRGVFNREGVFGLSLCSPLTKIAHVCCSDVLTRDNIHLQSHIGNENPTKTDRLHFTASLHPSVVNDGRTHRCFHTKTRTDVTSNVNKDSLRYAQATGSKASARTLISCTRLLNAKLNVHHSVKRCHSQNSTDDPKPTKSTRLQTDSVTKTSTTFLDDTTRAQLTHTDAHGRATMVDVGGKVPTRREASASATVLLGSKAFSLLRENQLVKGDALAVAQLAGIMASKQTSALIPLCHPLPLDHTSVTFDLDEPQNRAIITATCRTTGRTGVEMEALTAASVAALTIYDMCKAVSHDITITDIKLISKTGGKRDFHRHPHLSTDNKSNATK